MRSKTTKVVIFLIAALFAVSLTACTPLKAPAIEYKSYEITDIKMTKADLAFIFDVENTNDTSIGIKNITWSLSLDGSGFLSGTQDGFDINAKEKKSVRVPVEVVYADLIGQAANVAKKFIMKDNTIKYELQGKAELNQKSDLPVNLNLPSSVPFSAAGEISF